MSVGVFRF